MAKRYNVCDSIWMASGLSIAACTRGGNCVVIGKSAFRVSGIALIGLRRGARGHDTTVRHEIPHALDSYMCVQPCDAAWHIDYRAAAPAHTSHAIASAASYLYVDTRGVEHRVRWNVPFMTPDPFYVFRGTLRVWIDSTYYEVPRGTLVSLGRLFCEALIERGPWTAPYRVRRAVADYFRTHNIVMELECVVANYLYEPIIVAQTERYVIGSEEPPDDTRVAPCADLHVVCGSIGSMSFNHSSTIFDTSLVTEYDIPEMLRPLARRTPASTPASAVSATPASSPLSAPGSPQSPKSDTVGTPDKIASTHKRKSLAPVAHDIPPQPTRASSSDVYTTPKPTEASWTCEACTFVNCLRPTACEMCETPRAEKRTKT